MNDHIGQSLWLQSLAKAMASVAAVLALGGCMTSAYVATKVEGWSNDRSLNKGMAHLRAYIEHLRKLGDPQGDYYYALANSDGWIKDVKDPKAITVLFEQAAAKGSVDAQILLALQEAMSEDRPGKLDYGQGPRENPQRWESGLAKLLPLLQQQCYARRLVIDDGRPRLRHYSIAYKVWPTFRDGYYRRNEDGSRTLIRDPERHALWEGIHRRCLAEMPKRQYLDEHFNLIRSY